MHPSDLSLHVTINVANSHLTTKDQEACTMHIKDVPSPLDIAVNTTVVFVYSIAWGLIHGDLTLVSITAGYWEVVSAKGRIVEKFSTPVYLT